MKDLSIIIISYNTAELLDECLESVEKFKPKKYSYEVIVVDNASSDNSVEMVKKNHKSVHVIENKENFGFSKANNIGIKNSQGKYILFLNSDTVMHEHTLDTVLDFMESNKKTGAATCKVVMLNGKIDDASHRGFPTPWNAIAHFTYLSKIFPKSKIFSGYQMGWEDLTKIHKIDVLAGAFMMVRKEAGEEVGWWDEDYFWYGEDIDFCYNLKQKGWEIYYLPQVSILHYKGASGGIKKETLGISKASEETKIRATKARFNAMRIFYRKHYTKKYPSFLTWLVLKGVSIKEFITLKTLG